MLKASTDYDDTTTFNHNQQYKKKYKEANAYNFQQREIPCKKKMKKRLFHRNKYTINRHHKEQLLHDLCRTPPWISERTKLSLGIIKLHYEIIDFYDYIRPKENEDQKRNHTLTLFSQMIHSTWPAWKIKIFGSYPQGTHLIDSDIDIVVFKNNDDIKDFALRDTNQLDMIYHELLRKDLVSEIRYVDARVPIIKAKCKETGISMDIRKNGYHAAKIIKSILAKQPFLKPTIVLLKHILRQKGLNETYSGGMSSFLLFSIVYAYLQYIIKEEREPNEIESSEGEDKITPTYIYAGNEREYNIGTFLLGFLRFYSYELDYRNIGISLQNGGEFFTKIQRNFQYNENLSVENFQDSTQDIGKGAYNFPAIITLFKETLRKLYKVSSNCPSFLASIISY